MNRHYVLLVLIAIIFVVSGCDVDPTSNATYRLNQDEVDPRFREFYDWLGGEEILGAAISQKFSFAGYEYQYTATALMVYAPNAVDSQRYQLAPLGMELGIGDLPLNPDAPAGHEIYPVFMTAYTRMGGARYAGLPITEARYNPDKGRIEQFFENVGYYHLESNIEEIRLLQYGAWKCAEHCGYEPPADAEVVLWASVGSNFDAAIQRLDPGFTGYPLTEPYTTDDEGLEQIFENVVIVADPINPGKISLSPILDLIGLPVESGGDNFVPDIFLEFINRNSGLEFSGQPVSEYLALSSEVYRQCFTNLCLDYYPNAPEGLKVRPAPLGYTYKSQYYQSEEGFNLSDQSKEITLRVWESFPLLSNTQNQEIGVRVGSGPTPLKNFEPILTVYVPGSDQTEYTFPPTNKDGTSYIQLKVINAPNGTRIEYQVCVEDLTNQQYCVVDDFMIWAE